MLPFMWATTRSVGGSLKPGLYLGHKPLQLEARLPPLHVRDGEGVVKQARVMPPSGAR